MFTQRSLEHSDISSERTGAFLSKLLVDFLHIQYIDFMPHWRHSKTRAISRIYFRTAPPQYLHFTAMMFSIMNLRKRPNHAVERLPRMFSRSPQPQKQPHCFFPCGTSGFRLPTSFRLPDFRLPSMALASAQGH